MSAPADAPSDDELTLRLLAHLGTAMIATGQPVHEIEQELVAVGARLGHPGIQLGAGPTSLTLALSAGAPATFAAAQASLRLDQASDVRRIRHQLLTGEMPPDDAFAELAALRHRPPLYPRWTVPLAWVAVAAGIALILQPGWANVTAAAGCALVVVGLLSLARRMPVLMVLLPTVAAFVVSCIVFAAAHAGLVQGPLRTVLPPLAVLLPGALMVTGMSELAAGHMQAGSARLTYGTVQLGLFALGLVAAVAVLRVPPEMLANLRVDTVGWWAAPLGILAIGVGISLMESVQWRLMPWILLVLLVTFLAQTAGQLSHAGLGGFLGAITATLGAALVEARRPQLARLVVFLPSFWLLVPGSLGLVGVSQLVADPAQALDFGLGVVVVIAAIALGLLVGSAVARPLADLVRRAPSLG
jgi:uncharacterized membrane protein YjjP (DUF1212 family)